MGPHMAAQWVNPLSNPIAMGNANTPKNQNVSELMTVESRNLMAPLILRTQRVRLQRVCSARMREDFDILSLR